ncbi:MAG: DUF4280 domain-containing protein [Chloroflexi bacterium]|nr:DUF4280 domain-containing protein [Chloroflexota bacterium]
MAQQVVNGAQLMCSFGTAPSALVVTPENMTNANKVPAATIMDNVPMKNIMPFAMCITLSNPQVAAATSAALGVLTPQPCIPVTAAPWTPGSPTVLVKSKPALTNTCTLMCNWGGSISVVSAGQTTVNAA